MKKSKHKTNGSNQVIGINKKAFHDYKFEQELEVGICLEGWEVKSIRANKIQLVDSYVIIKNHEVWLIGTLINPLGSICTHTPINPDRTRKLLLHAKQINSLIGLTKQQGFTLVPQTMYWVRNKIKLKIGLAKGKKAYDKRAADQERTWKIQQQRLIKQFK